MTTINYLGMKIVESPYPLERRNYEFDPQHKVPVSDACRARMEAWVKEFFRPHPYALVLNPSGIGFRGEQMIVVDRRSMAAIRNLVP